MSPLCPLVGKATGRRLVVAGLWVVRYPREQGSSRVIDGIQAAAGAVAVAGAGAGATPALVSDGGGSAATAPASSGGGGDGGGGGAAASAAAILLLLFLLLMTPLLLLLLRLLAKPRAAKRKLRGELPCSENQLSRGQQLERRWGCCVPTSPLLFGLCGTSSSSADRRHGPRASPPPPTTKTIAAAAATRSRQHRKLSWGKPAQQKNTRTVKTKRQPGKTSTAEE